MYRLPEIAARAKCEKLRVVKTVPVGKVLARFPREEVAEGDLAELDRCQVRLPVKGAKFSTEWTPAAYKLCRFPGTEVRR